MQPQPTNEEWIAQQAAAAKRRAAAIEAANALLAKYGVPATVSTKAAHTNGKRALRRQAMKG